MDTTRVEVTLAQFSGEAKESKACWYPFQKQRSNRRGEIWDVDNPKIEKSSRLNICSTSSSEKRAARKERSYQNKNSKKKAGSVSTGTADNSLLSDETRTTVKTGSSSQGTLSINNRTQVSPSKRVPPKDQNSVAGFSHQANSIAETPKRFPKRRSKYVQSPSHFNQQVRPQSSQSKGPKPEPQEFDGVYKADKVVDIETNCISKDFWADEGYNCSEGRKKRLDCGRAVQNRRLKDSSTTPTKSPKGVEGIQEPSVEKVRKPRLGCNATSTSAQLGNVLRFVMQDPEVANESAPMRRILCSSVPFPKGGAPMICQDRRALSKHQGRRDTNIFQVLHKHGRKKKGMPAQNADEDEPNFYVEVQAMREQLNNIRDLEEITAEAEQSKQSLVNKELQNELPQGHKKLPAPSDIYCHDSDDSAINERFRAHVQRERGKRQQDGDFEPQKTISSTRLSTPQRQAQFRSRIREKIGRQNQLLNEMVSDRVLSMAGSDIASSASRNSLASNDFVERQSTLKTSNQVKSRADDDFVARQSTFKTSNQVHSRRVALMDQGAPHVPMQANNALHMDAFVDTPLDFSTPNRLQANMPDHRIAARDALPSWDREEKKEEWQESDIGFYRKLEAPPQIHNTASSHQRDQSMDREIFDDNFWKEDNSDINSAAFEQFGSEVDGTCDQGRNGIPPQSTQEIFDSFERNFQDSFGFDSVDVQSKSAGTRTTYLQ